MPDQLPAISSTAPESVVSSSAALPGSRTTIRASARLSFATSNRPEQSVFTYGSRCTNRPRPETRIRALQFPAELSRIALALAEFAEGVLLPAMPQYGFAEHHAKRHLINQSLKLRALAPRAMKINVRPRPEMPVPVAAIVPLHSKA